MLLKRGTLLHSLIRPALPTRVDMLHKRIRVREPLAPHTTLGVGGQAACYVAAETPQQLVELIGLCRRWNQRYLVLGAGSKVLISDRGFPGVVIATDCLRGLVFEDGHVRVLAGERLFSLLDAANRRGVRSLNFLAGIPGSLGGAIAMNAGIPGRSIGDVVTEVAIVDPSGDVKIFQADDCEFGYRQSAIRKLRLPVLWARLRLDGESYDREKLLAQRLARQPVFARSAGCVFKNSPDASAGRLIEEAGLKGLRVGMAKVSEKHANFILNLGGASSAEIRKLIDIVSQKVYKSFRVLLELEIEVIDGIERGN